MGCARNSFDPAKYATTFGYAGTYLDYAREAISDGIDLGALVDLSITKEEVAEILTKSGFRGYRFYGASEWVVKAVEVVRELSC